jgi:DUF1126 PH-like domain
MSCLAMQQRMLGPSLAAMHWIHTPPLFRTQTSTSQKSLSVCLSVCTLGVAMAPGCRPSLQGVFMKRSATPRRPDGSAFRVRDFVVGGEVTMCGRTFHLVDADAFTREYTSERLQVCLAPALPYPQDPVDVQRPTPAGGSILPFTAILESIYLSTQRHCIPHDVLPQAMSKGLLALHC